MIVLLVLELATNWFRQRVKHSSAFLRYTSRKSFKNEIPHSSSSLPDIRLFLSGLHPRQQQKNLNPTILVAGSAEPAGRVASVRLWRPEIDERPLSYSSFVRSAAALHTAWQGGGSAAPIRPFLNAFLLMLLGKRNRRHCGERGPSFAACLTTRPCHSLALAGKP